MRTITRSGSLAIVNTNKPNGGPKAINVQPKNSIKVILKDLLNLYKSYNKMYIFIAISFEYKQQQALIISMGIYILYLYFLECIHTKTKNSHLLT